MTHVLRGAPSTYLSWADVREGRPAAGRYLIAVDQNDTTVTPASREHIERHLTPAHRIRNYVSARQVAGSEMPRCSLRRTLTCQARSGAKQQ